GLFKLFLAFPREGNAFLKKFHRIVERKLRAFEFADDFFEARKRLFKFRLLCRFRFFCYWSVHSSSLVCFAKSDFWCTYFWQALQKYVDRPPLAIRRIKVPQRRQCRSSKSYARRIFSSPRNHHAGSRKSGAGCKQHSKARRRTDTIAL